MQTVILAAGKGTRMKDLTVEIPKPMLKVANKNLLEHKLDLLPNSVTEVIIVIGYKGEKIKEYFGDMYKNKKIVYVEQTETLGTGHALWQVQHLIQDKFLVMMGDDIYSKHSIDNAIKHPFTMTVTKTPGFKTAGNVVTNDQGFLQSIDFDREGVLPYVHMDIGLYSLSKEIFNHPLIKIPGTTEWGLPHTLTSVAHIIPIRVLEADMWMKINSPEHISIAEHALSQTFDST